MTGIAPSTVLAPGQTPAQAHTAHAVDPGVVARSTEAAASPSAPSIPEADLLTTEHIMSRKDLLNRYPQLRDALGAVAATKPPPGVTVSHQGSARVVTINLQGGVPYDPADEAATEGAGRDKESIQALRDVAAYIKSIDADVVMVNEIRQSSQQGRAGIPRQADVLYHLLGADSVAFAPTYAPGASKKFGGDTTVGNAVFTRNGYSIDKAVVADLQNSDVVDKDTPNERVVSYQNNNAVIASIATPSGEQLTAISTHLSPVGLAASDGERYPEVSAGIRGKQLARLRQIIAAIESGGSFDYRTSVTNTTGTASGFGRDAVLVGGDFNARSSTVEQAWTGAGLVNGWSQIDPATAAQHGAQLTTSLHHEHSNSPPIDHIFIAGGTVEAGHRQAIHHAGGGYTGDHASVFFDVSM